MSVAEDIMRDSVPREESKPARRMVMVEPEHEDKVRRFLEDIKRPIPHNAEVEQALLGAMLRNNRAFEVSAGLLEPEYFFVPEHQELYRLIRERIERGETANPSTLSHQVESIELCREAGGFEYLSALSSNVVTVFNAKEYAETIRDLHIKREMIGLALEIQDGAYDQSVLDRTGDVLMAEADQALNNLSTTGRAVHEPKQIHESMLSRLEDYSQAFRDPESVVIVPTGLVDLDKQLGGLKAGKLYIVAGRPAMGKSTLMQTIARNVGRRGRGTALIFTLEMPAEELADREFQYATGLDPNEAIAGRIDQKTIEMGMEAVQRFRNYDIVVDDTPDNTMARIDLAIRRQKRKGPVAAVFIDYLQIVDADKESKRYGSRVTEVSEMTRAAKQMSKRHMAPVVLLSQLSRQVESREDKRPRLSDLRESGSIEQDADSVVFVYRAEEYLKRETPEQRPNEASEKFDERYLRWEQLFEEKRNLLELIVDKNRGGQTGVVETYCDYSRMLIDDLDRTGRDIS